ncbi:histidine kinase 2 isoform X1 [Sesamum indicum]|uniref:histidine kinase n=1 Tax=Sesamum indicum TaxID=4182 RepID=A0A6I9TPP2_SESIN|nr:histidine kinase 2 isoform X1 [Sesamum indicum]XP_020551424.1 histidine kinase 2 isoform X1 [Sesamum indicum]
MSFSTVSWVTLKVARPLLNVCKWFLVKMSSNGKNSGSNGNLCSSYNPQDAQESWHGRASDGKWRRGLVLLWLIVFSFVFIWVLYSILTDGRLGKKVETPLTSGDEAQDSLENCNASMEKIVSMACRREWGCVIPPRTILCALKMLGSRRQIFHRLWELVAEKVGLTAPCPSIEATGAIYHGLPSSQEISSSFFNTTVSSISSAHLCCKEQNELRMREIRTDATDHCETIYYGFAKICLGVLIGMAVSYNLRKFYDKTRSQKHEMRQKLPLLQHAQLQQQAQSSSRSTGKWRKKLLVIFVLGGVIFSVWLFWYLNEDIMLRRKETLASMCDERARMLQDQFNVSMNHVHALAILVSTFHHGKQPSAIDQKTFEDYTERTAFERPLTSGVAYALRVRHSERERIEQQYGWTIKKMDVEDQTLAQDYNPENFSTSPVQDEYAPVIFSQKTVSHIVSIDMMSGKEDRENILRARASGKGVLTSPFKLLKSNHLGVVLTFAVYNTNLPPDALPEQRINATVGYLGASYDVPSLVEKLLHQLASKQTIIVNVYDTTKQAAPIKMYGTDVADMGLLHTSYLDFGDPTRKHEMHCRFKQKPSPPWQAITASLGTLVITLLLGHIFHAAINQIDKVEQDYQEMMKLKHRAEAADVAKSQFLATVSHEIRTPMNGVLGMLQMLMDTNLDACQLDYAQTAHDSGKDLISLINKVLDQAKIESGRLELEAVPFDLRAVLDKVLSIFSGKSHEKGIELAVYVSNKVPQVVIGDQERFGQIVTNLVGNSIKFTNDKGHIFVSVHLADEVRFPQDMRDEVLRQSLNVVQDDLNASFNTLSGFRVVDRWRSWENFKNLGDTADEPGKIKLLVTVEDTGTGIPPEAQGRIFTPFMQADSSTSRKYGGTGIGLSISKRLVDLMGGEIGFVSKLNTGSTFTFTVTFTKAEANLLDKIWQPCDPAVSELKGLRALVIDEKRIRAEVVRYHLERLGISVNISSSMKSACSYLSSVSESENFAMVLIDQENWDKETCFSFHSLIKKMRHTICRSERGFSLKIFLLATCLSSTDRNKLKLDELVNDLITKPLRLSALVSTFQEATGKRLDTRGNPSRLKNLLKGKQILVVDDNIVNRRVAEGALKKYGAVVTCVEGGKFAVELLKPPHEYDACFMDLQMPEIDGFEATRQIRSLEKEYNERISCGETSVGGTLSRWHTPILAMTADVIQATNEACMKCGMDDYVSKPFGEGQLYSAVARFFETG